MTPRKIAKWKRIAEGDYEAVDGTARMWRVPDVQPPAWNVEKIVEERWLIVDGAATMHDAKALYEEAR